MTKVNDTEHWWQGAASYQIGKTLADCPHPVGSVERRRWRKGWREAKEAMPPRVDKMVVTTKRKKK